jgi:hypothetical protein
VESDPECDPAFVGGLFEQLFRIEKVSRKSASPSDIKNLDFINAGTFRPEFFSSRQERWLIALLCFVAALRIFFFSAAFPFFNGVMNISTSTLF